MLHEARSHPTLGRLVKRVFDVLNDQTWHCRFTPGQGQSASAVARMYEIRRAMPKLNAAAFDGMDEAIESMRNDSRNVHLVLLETSNVLVSVWLDETMKGLVAIVLAQYPETS